MEILNVLICLFVFLLGFCFVTFRYFRHQNKNYTTFESSVVLLSVSLVYASGDYLVPAAMMLTFVLVGSFVMKSVITKAVDRLLPILEKVKEAVREEQKEE